MKFPRLAAGLGALALVSASVLVATPASATDPANLCGSGAGTFMDIETAGALWFDVCQNSGFYSEVSTTNKSDAVDGFGYLYINYNTPDEEQIGATAANTTVTVVPGVSAEISFVDTDVEYTAGDLVDVAVTRLFQGTTTSWEIEVTDADDGTPRPDVAITIGGNLGSDGQTQFTTTANSIVGYGDPADPINMWQIQSSTYGWNLSGDDVEIFVNSGTVVHGVVDYDCRSYDDAVDFGEDTAPNLIASFGLSFQVAGTDPCSAAASPIYLTQGQAFEVPVDVTAFPGGFDMSNGFDTYLWWSQDFIDYDTANTGVPNVVPTLTIFGTAPALPGEYWIIIALDEYVSGEGAPYPVGEAHWVKLIVGPPTLPATGPTSAPLVAIALLLALAGTAAVVVARRARAA